jgi:hypothetical protein
LKEHFEFSLGVQVGSKARLRFEVDSGRVFQGNCPEPRFLERFFWVSGKAGFVRFSRYLFHGPTGL